MKGPQKYGSSMGHEHESVAPVVFVDGHVKHFNLKQHFRSTWPFIAEPTPDRIWYKAKE
jgi:prepilin-type processing-associated H-X9-DG protein